jgi:hypothetical protein
MPIKDMSMPEALQRLRGVNPVRFKHFFTEICTLAQAVKEEIIERGWNFISGYGYQGGWEARIFKRVDQPGGRYSYLGVPIVIVTEKESELLALVEALSVAISTTGRGG